MKYLFIILTIIHSTMGAGELKRRSLGHPDNNAQLVNPDGKVEIPVLYDDQSVNLEFDLTGIENGVSGLLYDKDNDQFVAIRNNFTATAAPAAANDATQGYRPGSKWYDANNDKLYECIDNSEGAAVWKDSSGGLNVDDSAVITGNWAFNSGAVFGPQLYIGTLVNQGIVRTITPSAPIIYGLNNTVPLGLAKHHFKGQSTNTYLAVFDGDVSFLGDVIVSGTTFQVDSEISTADTVIAINDGEVGAGVTLGYAGTYIDRGSANPYFFGYDEVRDGFAVGEITELSTAQIATTQMIATREDNPTDGYFAQWDDANKRFNAVAIDTDVVAEGSNLYYTDPRVQSFLSGGSFGADINMNENDLLEVANLSYTGLMTIDASMGIDINYDGLVKLSVDENINLNGPTIFDNGNNFSSLDIYSSRTTGNIGGLRWYNYLDNEVRSLVSDVNGNLIIYKSTTEQLKLTDDGSVIVGNPTGGAKGAGTINAIAVYDDNIQLSDYVFEKEYTGKTIDKIKKNFKRKSLLEEIEFTKKHLHLSSMIGRDDWKKSQPSIGDLISQLWETIEIQFLYISEINQKLKDHEQKI